MPKKSRQTATDIFRATAKQYVPLPQKRLKETRQQVAVLRLELKRIVIFQYKEKTQRQKRAGFKKLLF